MMRFLIIASILALSACSQSVRVETVTVSPPAALLTCRNAPAAPTSDTTTQRDVARFIVRLSEAGEDCRSKLGAVKDFVNAEAEQ